MNSAGSADACGASWRRYSAWGPHTISVPRICPADDIDPAAFDNGISDDIFCQAGGLYPYCRPLHWYDRLHPGESGYPGEGAGAGHFPDQRRFPHQRGRLYRSRIARWTSEQFDVSDQRTLDEVVGWLMERGHIPSFCTACYREGRTGDRFMSLCKSGQILNCCHPNALMTLKEYLMDYASPETRALGEQLITREIERVPNEKARSHRQGQPGQN